MFGRPVRIGITLRCEQISVFVVCVGLSDLLVDLPVVLCELVPGVVVCVLIAILPIAVRIEVPISRDQISVFVVGVAGSFIYRVVRVIVTFDHTGPNKA